MLTTVNERIAAVRGLMKANGISAIIIPGADPHMSEYFSEHWATTTFISGFTGETGTVVITMDMAGLWTDGRYYIQAANEYITDKVVFATANPFVEVHKAVEKYQRLDLTEECRRKLFYENGMKLLGLSSL